MGVAVGISSLGGIELEIPLGGIFNPPPWPLTVGKNPGHMRVNICFVIPLTKILELSFCFWSIVIVRFRILSVIG